MTAGTTSTTGIADTDDFPAWVSLAVMGGLLGVIAGKFTGVHAVTLAGAVPLIVGTIAYLAHGGKLIGTWGKREQRSPAVARGLVGSRISNGETVFTVLDDTAVTGSGRRASVVAADENGTVGLLFVGLDRRGRVTEARVANGEWTTAAVID